MAMGRIVGMAGDALKKVPGMALGMGRDLAIWGVGLPMLTNAMSGNAGASEAGATPAIKVPEYYIDPLTRQKMMEGAALQQFAGVNSIAKGM